jgi:hypothetical protein
MLERRERLREEQQMERERKQTNFACFVTIIRLRTLPLAQYFSAKVSRSEIVPEEQEREKNIKYCFEKQKKKKNQTGF